MNTLTLRRLAAALALLGAATISMSTLAADAPAAAPAAAPVAAPPAVPYVIPAGIPKYIRAAVESKSRPAAMTSRDANRKPAEVLALSGVKPGDRVIEFASFGQYFTTLLSDIVGKKGLIYMYDLPYTEARSGKASREFVAAHPNSRYELVDYNTFELPQKIDIVFNVLYYHDLPLNKVDTANLNGRIFKALKPGGTFFIVDHNAAAGSGMRDTQKLHRIDPAIIKQEVLAAGFELVEESQLLAYPTDDHTQMVFSPGLRGMTDQTIFKFRKPRK
jgi:predicted methyltransferase